MRAFQICAVVVCAFIMCFKVNFSICALKGERFKNPFGYFRCFAGWLLSLLFLASGLLTILLDVGGMAAIQIIDMSVTFILASVVDIKTYKIPNETVIAFVLSQLLLSFATDIDSIGIWNIVIAGVILGVLILVSVVSHDQIGMGDVKILAATALIYGLSFVLYSLIFSLILMLIFAVPCLIMRKINLKSNLPLMPFYTVGVIIYIVINLL